jgi:hypothetical protein
MRSQNRSLASIAIVYVVRKDHGQESGLGLAAGNHLENYNTMRNGFHAE